MKNRAQLLTLATLLVTSPSYALFGLGDDKDKAIDTSALSAIATSALDSNSNQTESSALVELLSSQLNVSPTQATGGAGALLALASNSLAGDQSSELGNLIPGMNNLTGSAQSLTGMVNNLSAVNDVFAKLGLDPAMVTQFAPLIIQYLSGQGASNGLLDSLGKIWQ